MWHSNTPEHEQMHCSTALAKHLSVVSLIQHMTKNNIYEGHSVSSRSISFKKTTVASRKTFLSLFNIMFLRNVPSVSRVVMTPMAQKISVSGAEEVWNACC